MLRIPFPGCPLFAIALVLMSAPVQAATVWLKTYSSATQVADEARVVAVDPVGNAIVTGVSANNFLTLKYSKAKGSLLWQRRLPGYSIVNDMALDSQGNVFVTGLISKNGTATPSTFDFYTAKYASADGALVWSKRFDAGPGNDTATALVVDSNGNVIVTGVSEVNGTNTDFYTIKYNGGTGKAIWQKRFEDGTGSAEPTDIGVDGSNNVFITGKSTTSLGAGFRTLKYGAGTGNLLWSKSFNVPQSTGTIAKRLAMVGNDVVVTGASTVSGNSDIYTLRYRGTDGQLLWQKKLDGAFHLSDLVNDIAADENGNIYVTGSSTTTSGTSDVITTKYSGSGTLRWTRYYDGTGHGNDAGQAIALDGNGRPIVTGFSQGISSLDCITLTWSTSGQLVGDVRFDGDSRGADFGQDVAVDASNNVIVTGSTFTLNSLDYLTIKYSP